MSEHWDAKEWWQRTDRLRNMFNAYRNELQEINERLAHPLDAKTVVKIGVRVNRIQWRIQVLESMILRHAARAPKASASASATATASATVTATVTGAPAAQMRLH